MKKLILISSTLLAFAFTVGCGKGKLTKDECDEDDTKMWDAEKEECVDKVEEEKEVVYTLTSKSSGINVISGTDTLTLAKDGCVKVSADQFATLKVTATYNPPGSIKPNSFKTDVVCDNTDTVKDDPATADVDESTANDCTAGNYQIVNRALVKQDAMNESADCKTLGAKEAPAKAEGDAKADSKKNG